jgi:hypothetical protein
MKNIHLVFENVLRRRPGIIDNDGIMSREMKILGTLGRCPVKIAVSTVHIDSDILVLLFFQHGVDYAEKFLLIGAQVSYLLILIENDSFLVELQCDKQILLPVLAEGHFIEFLPAHIRIANGMNGIAKAQIIGRENRVALDLFRHIEGNSVRGVERDQTVTGLAVFCPNKIAGIGLDGYGSRHEIDTLLSASGTYQQKSNEEKITDGMDLIHIT